MWENLAQRPGVYVACSVAHPTGRGARDPSVLLSNPPAILEGQPLTAFLDYRAQTYDTYDGHNLAHGEDWYALHFPTLTTLNCIQMTMECPNRDGGWWTSLRVEVLNEEYGEWQAVSRLEITPPYNFADTPYDRVPYETYFLTFEAVSTRAIRLMGQPGGLAQFTSLSYLAAFHYQRVPPQPQLLPSPPTPYIFQLIPPAVITDLSESLVKLTGLSIGVAYMDHYLDRERYQRWWQRIRHNYTGEPELWQLLGASIGWNEWVQLEGSEGERLAGSGTPARPQSPFIRFGFHHLIARAVAPITVDQQVLGEMQSNPVMVEGVGEPAWHRRYAEEHGIAWEQYSSALARSPRLSLEQLEGAAEMMGMIANTIANLAHHNLKLERELKGVRSAAEQRAAEKRSLVNRAIAYMVAHLEDPISVTEIAREIALSPTYFGILFTEQMGCSPIDYLINLRIERAKHYLRTTPMSVMEVCTALGYNSSYFNRLFKLRVGCTPGQFAARPPAVNAPPM